MQHYQLFTTISTMQHGALTNVERCPRDCDY